MLGEIVLVILLWGLFCVFILWLTEKLYHEPTEDEKDSFTLGEYKEED